MSQPIYPLGVNTVLLSKGRGELREAGQVPAPSADTHDPACGQDGSPSRTRAGTTSHTTPIREVPVKTPKTSLAVCSV